MIFSNSGLNGRDLSELHRNRLLQWMNLRFFTGFSEWLSNIFYDEHLTALLQSGPIQPGSGNPAAGFHPG